MLILGLSQAEISKSDFDVGCSDSDSVILLEVWSFLTSVLIGRVNFCISHFHWTTLDNIGCCLSNFQLLLPFCLLWSFDVCSMIS